MLKLKSSKLSLQKCSPKRANTLFRNIVVLSFYHKFQGQNSICQILKQSCWLNPISGPRRQTLLKHQGHRVKNQRRLGTQSKLARDRKAGTKWQCKNPASITQKTEKQDAKESKTQMSRASTNGQITRYSVCQQRTKGWEKELPEKYTQIQKTENFPKKGQEIPLESIKMLNI